MMMINRKRKFDRIYTEQPGTCAVSGEHSEGGERGEEGEHHRYAGHHY